MKYEIPSTEGAYSSCRNWVVQLSEIQLKDDYLPLKRYLISWPDSPAMEGLLSDYLTVLNDILSQRGINLKWSYREGSEIFQRISMQGMFHITQNVDVPKVAIVINGKTYRIKVEKLEELIKGLE